MDGAGSFPAPHGSLVFLSRAARMPAYPGVCQLFALTFSSLCDGKRFVGAAPVPPRRYGMRVVCSALPALFHAVRQSI